jgi:peptide/nickel transport system ATP-binding protein
MQFSTPVSAERVSDVPLLDVRDLRVSFRTQNGLVRAVDGVSFAIGQGEIVGVVGESGCGKTVSLLSVMGLIRDPNAIIEGSIRYRGQELVGLPQRELRRLRGREIAMIFQDPMTALTPVYTIGAQIVEQIRIHNAISRRAARARAIDLLRDVGIANPAMAVDRYPHQLSGGMRQRAFIAMALSCRPSLLIADEPTTALDVTVQAQILDLIFQQRQELGSAVVMVTHDLGVVAELVDRVIVMYAGRVVEAGTKSDVFRHPRHPYTWGLFGSIPPLTGPRRHRLASIPGAPPSLIDRATGCAFGPRCQYNSTACLTQPLLEGEEGHLSACVLSVASRDQAQANLASGGGRCNA